MINGIINVYKEEGFTSHDVVAKLRGILRQRKIGHTGTLDPNATGVLPVCLGSGTKLCDLLTDKSKTYEATFVLGKVTDTQDIWGAVIEEHEVCVSDVGVRDCVYSFLGEQDQIPPMYSAIKVDGKKLYELARAGKEIERKPRKVTFHQIEILECNLPEVRIKVSCSKGTYIRTLCHDIGKKLQCGACMSKLVRTQVDQFSIENSLTLGKIEELSREGQIANYLVKVDEMFCHLPVVSMLPKFNVLVYNGNKFHQSQGEVRNMPLVDGVDQVRVYDSKNQFIGIFRYVKKDECFVPVKMFLGT